MTIIYNIFILIIVKRIFLMAPPGSSKKTYSKCVTDNFDCVLIETGDILKNEILKNN